MLKLVIQLVLLIMVLIAIFYVLDPVLTYRILSSILPLPTSSTSTISTPSNLPSLYLNVNNSKKSYTVSQDTALYVSGNNDVVTVHVSNGVQILYLHISGNLNIVGLQNGFAALNVTGNQNIIDTYDTSIISSSLGGSGNRVYNQSYANSTSSTVYNFT